MKKFLREWFPAKLWVSLLVAIVMLWIQAN